MTPHETTGGSGAAGSSSPGLPDERRAWFASRWLCIALIAVAAAAAYSNSLHNPFIFDDKNGIVDNRSIRRLWPPQEIFLLRPAAGSGLHARPVVNLTFAANYAMGGLDTLPYHLTNLLIHLLAGLALFGIVHRTLALPGMPERLRRAAMPLALAASLLWTVHPLQTQAVSYVTQRYESLMGLLCLAALFCLVRAATSKQARAWGAASVAAAALALGSKEVAVSLPLVLLLYDRAFLAGSVREAWLRRRGLYLGLLGAWAAFAALQFLSADRSRWSGYDLPVSWHAYASTQFGVVLHYLRLSLWPRPLVLDYGWPLAKGAREILPAALVVGGLAAASAHALVRRPKLGFLGASFFLILAPTSSVLPLADRAFEYRMYLPLAAVVVGVVLAGDALVDAAVRRGRLGPRSAAVAATGVVAVLAVAMAAGTWQRNRDYRSEESIWRDTVAKAPRNARAHYSLGAILDARGQREEAIAHFRRALEINPYSLKAHNNLGVALANLGRTEEAIAHFRKALEVRADFPEANNNLGFMLAVRGRTQEAIAHYRRALEAKPSFAEAHNHLGLALLSLGRTEEATAHFRKALEINPGYSEARQNLSAALAARAR